MIGLSAAWLGSHQRFARRLRIANERLDELRFLLERRYELSRVRLDKLLEISDESSVDTQTSRASEDRNVSKSKAQIENLSARFQRTERRIIGRLEGESFANDRRNREIADLIQRLDSKL